MVAYPVPDCSPFAMDLQNKEIMTIAPQKMADALMVLPTWERKEKLQDNIARIGIVFVFPNNTFILYSFSLSKGCSNIGWNMRPTSL